MSHQIHDPQRWPLFEIRAQRLDDRRTRIYVSLDLLIVDAESVRILMNELEVAYRDDGIGALEPLQWTFRNFVLAYREFQAAHAAPDQAFWNERIRMLPPAPPVGRAPGRAGGSPSPVFARQHAVLDETAWSAILRHGPAGASPSAIIAAASARSCGSGRPRRISC